MPQTIETPPLALRAITAIFDTTFLPLFSEGIDFVAACLNDVYPDRFSHVDLGKLPLDSKFWVCNHYRVSTNLFGIAGDVLLWIPSPAFPDGFAAIRTPDSKLVTSSPLFDFTATGRMQIHTCYFKKRPDIVLRFGK
jgi:hypothetical protein